MALAEAARFNSRIEAELARSRLEAAGIDAILFGAESGSLGLGPLAPILLMVIEEDLAEAMRLLAGEL